MSIWVCNYCSQCWLFTTLFEILLSHLALSSCTESTYLTHNASKDTKLYSTLSWFRDKKNLRLDRIIISTNSPFFISIFLYLDRFSFFLVFSLFSLFFTTVSNDRVIRRASELLLCIETSKEKCLWQTFFFRQVFWPAPKIKGCAIVRV